MTVLPLAGSLLAVLPSGDSAAAQLAAPLRPWHYGLPHAAVEDPAQHNALAVRRVDAAAPGFYRSATNVCARRNTVGWQRQLAWQLSEGVVPQPVAPRKGFCRGPVDPAPETLSSISYGCSKLRAVAWPVIS